ncbi:MAG: hypothetical protein F6J87_07905 [Spirulina sp. SIO3F2]|nr:hypothetical protein [Spirulina sp. SIO3F2]
MSSAVEQTGENPSGLTGKTVITAGITWGALSLIFFLFNLIQPETEDTLWYLVGTYVAEWVPSLAGIALCYRNWRSPKIASGRNVWLAIGLGILAYFLADLIFCFWEVYWELDPEVSPADLFYMAFYMCLGTGMILAVLSRRMSLELWQWITLSLIAIAGTSLAVWIALAEPAIAIDEPPVLNSEAIAITEIAPAETIDAETEAPEVPQWVTSTQDYLLQFSTPVNFFYIICDVGLLIIAVMLLLAFWGGTFSLSWRMIAAAALARYLADMWFKYSATLPTEYASGGFLEVFFVFSGILFAIGAALEFDISSRPRKSRRRRTRAAGEGGEA